MPANPNKSDYECRRWIDNLINKMPPEGYMLKEIERHAIITFPVSPTMVRKFIKEYYVDLNHVKIDDGIIKKNVIKNEV